MVPPHLWQASISSVTAAAAAEPKRLLVKFKARRAGAAVAQALPPGVAVQQQVTLSGVHQVTIQDGSSVKKKLKEVRAWPGELRSGTA